MRWVAHYAARVSQRLGSADNVAHPEIGKAGTCYGTDAQESKRAIVSLINVILAFPHVLKPCLKLMASVGVDQVVFELALCGVKYLDQILKSEAGRSAIDAGDVNLHQPRNLKVAAVYAELLTDVAQRRGWRFTEENLTALKPNRASFSRFELIAWVQFTTAFRTGWSLPSVAPALQKRQPVKVGWVRSICDQRPKIWSF